MTLPSFDTDFCLPTYDFVGKNILALQIIFDLPKKLAELLHDRNPAD